MASVIHINEQNDKTLFSKGGAFSFKIIKNVAHFFLADILQDFESGGWGERDEAK